MQRPRGQEPFSMPRGILCLQARKKVPDPFAPCVALDAQSSITSPATAVVRGPPANESAERLRRWDIWEARYVSSPRSADRVGGFLVRRLGLRLLQRRHVCEPAGYRRDRRA